MPLILALLLAFFVVFALWYSRQERKRNLSGFFLMAALVAFAVFLLFSESVSGQNDSAPNYRLFMSNLCVLIFMPCAYLYTRSTMSGRNINKRDWMHTLPATLFLLNALSLSGSGLLNGNATFTTAPGFLTFSHYVVLGYLFLQLQMLIPQFRAVCQPAMRSFYPLLRWAVLLVLAQSYFLWYRIAGSGNAESTERLWLQIPVLFECFLVVGIFAIKLIGKFLSSSNELMDNNQLEDIEIIDQLEAAPNCKSPLLPIAEESAAGIEFQDFQFRQVEEKVKTAIAGQQQFLTPGYTIRMLSEETGVSPHLLSAFINRRYEMNFNDFINEYRIRFCIEKIKNDEWKYKTLEALSRESGFNNRNSFTLSFKKVVGLTPSDFLKTLKVQ
jgi:AraC-like DNA-binding protein